MKISHFPSDLIGGASRAAHRLHQALVADTRFDSEMIVRQKSNDDWRINVPNINLISNIGFGPDATRTMYNNSVLANLQVEEIDFPSVHPMGLFATRSLDEKYAARLLFVSLI